MSKSKLAPFAIAGLLTGALLAHAQDEPDMKREKQFNRLYKRLNSQPTSDAKWSQALSSAKSQTYKVQKGDTLWNISETFFADPDFWPKIWSLNGDEILNPHEIRPDEQVQFQPGTIGEPPAITVGAKDDAGGAGVPESLSPEDEAEAKAKDEAEEAKPMAQYVDIDLNDVKLPPPRKATGKSAASVPASLPPWSFQTEEPAQTLVIDTSGSGGHIPPTEVSVLSYVQENRLNPVGEVVGAEGGMNMAHENQYVTVHLTGGAQGQKYLVVREVGELGGDADAKIIQIEGEVQVQDPVGPDSTYRAFVLRAHAPIQNGFKLVPGEVQRVTVADNEAAAEAPAHIVGGPDSTKRRIFAPGEVLFLSGGSRGGLAVGQDLSVFRIEEVRNPATDEKINPRRIGSLHIVRTTDRFATAVVTSALEELHVGDSTSRGAQVK